MIFNRKKCICILLLFSLWSIPVFSQGFFSNRRSVSVDVEAPASQHRGPVTALVYDEDKNILLSAGTDGYIVMWDLNKTEAKERFQISPYSIVSMALRPGMSELAVVESDGYGLYRISAWDYLEKKKLFTLIFRDPISYLTYSASGSFLIASRSARTGVVFIDPSNGQLRQSPNDLSGPLHFIATGKSERTMICYSGQGILSYWNLENGREIKQLSVLPDLESPILFGNNRFFAGIQNQGLTVFDAVSGNELGRRFLSGDAKIIGTRADTNELYILQGDNIAKIILDDSGYPRQQSQISIQAEQDISTALTNNSGHIIGKNDGSLAKISNYGMLMPFKASERIDITDIAVSGEYIGILGPELFLVLPNNMQSLRNDAIITLDKPGSMQHLAAGPDGTFILWSNDGEDAVKQWTSDGLLEVSGAMTGLPIKSMSTYLSYMLFLDSAGNINIINNKDKNKIFSYTSIGLLDAAFIDERRIIVGRSVTSRAATPFIIIDTVTGETVPGPYPIQAVTTLYRGESGTVYAAGISTDTTVKTGIYRLNVEDISDSTALLEFQGEDVAVSIAECAGTVVSSLGGDGASIFGSRGFYPLERSDGLPEIISSSRNQYVVLDTDGAIHWHAPNNGKRIMTLDLYEDSWILERVNGTNLKGSILQ